MDQLKSHQSIIDRDAVRRIVSNAESSGEHDIYKGKRTKPRFAEGIPLEITLDPSKPSAAYGVTMHNISEGGCAFWLRRKLDLRGSIFVRELSEDNSSPWLPGYVTHCTQGLRGYLVGMAFGERPEGR